jgi:hypothetical protein
MTARTTRRKKAASRTAYVGYHPPGPAAPRRRSRESYHAVTDQAVTLGPVTREPGQALCGLTGPWADAPVGLFPSLVTCPACRSLASSEGITISGDSS